MVCSKVQISGEHQPNQVLYYKDGWTFHLVLSAISVSLGTCFPVGYSVGVINTPAEVIKKFCNESFVNHYDMILDERWLNVLWSFVVSIFIVGACIGSIVGSGVANTLGRRMGTLIIKLLLLAGGALCLFCGHFNSVELLILGRLLAGLAAGLSLVIVPMYLTELAPLKLSGSVGVYCVINIGIGVLIGQIMGLDFLLGRPEEWPYLISVFALVVLFTLPILLLVPESPKYLYVIKRNEEQALKELCRLRSATKDMLINDINILSEELRCNECTEANKDNKWTMMSVLLDKRLRLPLLLVCSMQAGQQTSGISAIFFYSQTIFQQTGLSEKEGQYATIGTGVINTVAAILVIKLLHIFGRRPLLLFSTGASTVLLALLALSMIFIDSFWWIPYMSMALVLLYVLLFGIGLGPIPYFIGSELFEVGPRSAGMAWGAFSNCSGNFLIGMLFPIMRDTIGPYSFFVFSGLTGVLFIFESMYFPETKGRTATEVSKLCSRGLQSRPLEQIEALESE